MAGSIGTAYFNVAPNMSGVQGKITRGLSGTGQQFAKQFGGEISGKSAVVIGAVSGLVSSATSSAFRLMASQFSAAINRFDTIQNFPKVMQNFGIKTNDATAAMKVLVKGVSALPTSLNDIVSLTEAFTPFSKTVGHASKLALALNDALLAGGTPIYVQQAAMEQFRQALAKGMPQLQDWRSLESAMPAQLQQVSKALGLGAGHLKKYGANGQGLYNAMQDGKITLEDFNNTLLKLDKTGNAGFPSFEKQAKNASNGVGTAFTVLKQQIQQVMVDIMTSIGQQNISNAIKSVGTALKATYAEVKGFVKFIVKYKDIFAPLAVGVGAAVTALVAYNTVTKISKALTAANAVVTGYLNLVTLSMARGLSLQTAAWYALNTSMRANIIGIIATAIVGLTAALVFFFTKTETGRKIFANFMKFMSGVWQSISADAAVAGNFFAAVWQKVLVAVSAVKNAFNAAYKAVSNFVTAGIGVLNSAAQATLKWLYAWRQWFINIGIVIGTILLPTMLKLGIQAVKSAAQWVASMARAGAATAKTAATAVVNFVKMSISATINAAKSAAAWTVAAAKTTVAWLKTIPGMIVQFVQASAAATVNAVKTAAAWVLAAGQTSLGWGRTFAMYLAQVAVAAAQTLLAGARMAAAWLLALGPIGLVIAAVAGATALIIANWNGVKSFVTGVWHGIQSAVSSVLSWITGNWKRILAIITGPIGLAVLYVTSHFQQIKNGAANMINSLVGFFAGLPSRIVHAVGNLGSILYNSGVDMIKGLLSGAGSILPKVGQFFLDKLPGWIRGPFKKALGIHSPSKVFAGFGVDTVAGYVNSVGRQQSTVKTVMSDLATSAMDGFGANGLTANIAATAAPSAAVPSSSPNQSGNTTQQEVNIGTIILKDAGAVKQMFKELNQDTLLVSKGLTANQGAM